MLSEISEFSNLGVEQNKKIGNLRIFFFFEKHILTFKFFSQFIFVVSESWITTTLKVWSKRTVSKISEFLILDLGQNRKLGNLVIFFSSLTFKFLSQFIFCCFWILNYNKSQNLKWKNTFLDFWVFDFGCRAKSKTWKFRKTSFFLLKAYLDL